MSKTLVPVGLRWCRNPDPAQRGRPAAPRRRHPAGNRGADRRPSRIRDPDVLPGVAAASRSWSHSYRSRRAQYRRTARGLGGDPFRPAGARDRVESARGRPRRRSRPHETFDGGRPEVRLIANTATAMTRVLLLAYPPAFRRDVGNALTADVRRRAQELSGLRAAAWLVRLCASLLVNAVAAWGERVGTRRLRSRAPIGTLISWIDVKLAWRMLAKSPRPDGPRRTGHRRGHGDWRRLLRGLSLALLSRRAASRRGSAHRARKLGSTNTRKSGARSTILSCGAPR